jgi:hypothetical protein
MVAAAVASREDTMLTARRTRRSPTALAPDAERVARRARASGGSVVDMAVAARSRRTLLAADLGTSTASGLSCIGLPSPDGHAR